MTDFDPDPWIIGVMFLVMMALARRHWDRFRPDDGPFWP